MGSKNNHWFRAFRLLIEIRSIIRHSWPNILHKTYGWHPKKDPHRGITWCFEKKNMIWLINKREKRLSNLIIIVFFQPLNLWCHVAATQHSPPTPTSTGKKKRAANRSARTSMAESMWTRQPSKVLFLVTWDRSGNPPQMAVRWMVFVRVVFGRGQHGGNYL